MINNQDNLRKLVNNMKFYKKITYKYIANEVLLMNYQSFLHWINGKYDFGEEKTNKLNDFINNYKENEQKDS